MGRPALPKNVLKLKGTYSDRPSKMKDRENEPEPKNPLGNPPKSFNAMERRAWRELKKYAHEGMLGDSDTWAAELACVLMAEFRSKPKEFSAAKLTRLEALLGKFGMTPADRVKISIPSGKKQNPFDDD